MVYFPVMHLHVSVAIPEVTPGTYTGMVQDLLTSAQLPNFSTGWGDWIAFALS